MSTVRSHGTYITGMTFLHQIVFKICQNHWTMKYRLHWPSCIFRSIIRSHGTYIQGTSFWVIRQNHWTMKCRSQWPRYILCQSLGEMELIIQVWCSLSNSIQDIRHYHLTIKYRSHWPRYIFRSIIGSDGTYDPGMRFLRQIVFKILGKITEPWI